MCELFCYIVDLYDEWLATIWEVAVVIVEHDLVNPHFHILFACIFFNSVKIYNCE